MSKRKKIPKTEEAKDVSCYWQSDASPVPAIKLDHMATQKNAEKWLSKQTARRHSTPQIGKLTVSVDVAETPTVFPLTHIEEVTEEDCGCQK